MHTATLRELLGKVFVLEHGVVVRGVLLGCTMVLGLKPGHACDPIAYLSGVVTIVTMNCAATLKASAGWVDADHELCHTPLIGLKASGADTRAHADH
jgi:hypothetical protein